MDKLCVAERRIKILNLLMLQKQVTIRALKEEFQVSKNTKVAQYYQLQKVNEI